MMTRSWTRPFQGHPHLLQTRVTMKMVITATMITVTNTRVRIINIMRIKVMKVTG